MWNVGSASALFNLRRIFALAPELQPLPNAEAMLLIEYGQAQPGDINLVLNQRPRGYRKSRPARLEGLAGGLPPRAGSADGQPCPLHAQRTQRQADGRFGKK